MQCKNLSIDLLGKERENIYEALGAYVSLKWRLACEKFYGEMS